MSGPTVSPTPIPEVVEIHPRVFDDPRGFFLESWNRRTFSALGLEFDFVQDNHSRSRQGILRGLHYQVRQPQGKLVRVVSGRVFDVAVDLRRSSRTFGRWVGVWLEADRHNMLWIPPGFAHGFYVHSDSADLLYKCTAYYDPEDDHTLRWDDPEIGIDWPLVEGRPPLLSTKDADGRGLAQAVVFA